MECVWRVLGVGLLCRAHLTIRIGRTRQSGLYALYSVKVSGTTGDLSHVLGKFRMYRLGRDCGRLGGHYLLFLG